MPCTALPPPSLSVYWLKPREAWGFRRIELNAAICCDCRLGPCCVRLQSYCLEGADDADQDEQLFETWLLLEYCDKGSLQDAVDRGWFHTDKHGHVDSKTKPNMRAIR